MDTSDTGLLVGGGLLDSTSTTTSSTGGPPLASVDEPVTELAGGGGCGHVGMPSAWLLLLWVFWMSSAWAADVQLLQTVDAGRYVSVQDVSIQEPWAGRGALVMQVGMNPVSRLRADGTRAPYMTELTTVELSGSQAFGKRLRLGGSLPVHAPRVSGATSLSMGDALVFAAFSVKALALRAQFEQPLSKSALLGRRALTAGLVGSATWRRGSVGWHTQVRMQTPESIGGVEIGPRVEGAVGYQGAFSVLRVGVELFGSAPLRLPTGVRDFPLEALGTGGARIGRFGFRTAASVGLTRGLGTPEARLVAGVTVHGRTPVDHDGDGLIGIRDLCPRRAEDVDSFRDKNGCPDADNDGDGILDVEDACPHEPETQNGYLDTDGCPDHLGQVTLTVLGPEVFEVLWGEESRKQVEPDWHWRGEPGVLKVTLTSPGFDTQTLSLEVGDGEHLEQTVQLRAPLLGTFDLVVLDDLGRPTGADVHVAGVVVHTDGRLQRTLRAGIQQITVQATGFLEASLEFRLAADEHRTDTVRLERLVVREHGARLVVAETPRFVLDEDLLEDRRPLEAIAAWMRANPEVLLLRVEGHADVSGDSTHNYGLSRRRGMGVLEALVGLGVERERLEAIGSGEAHAYGGPRRQVSFLVLIDERW